MAKPKALLRRFFAPVLAHGGSLARDERGVTAIEFGLLGLPFFAIMLAVMETAMMFLGTQILADEASGIRLVATWRRFGGVAGPARPRFS